MWTVKLFVCLHRQGKLCLIVFQKVLSLVTTFSQILKSLTHFPAVFFTSPGLICISFVCVSLGFIVMQMHQLYFVTSYGRRKGKPAGRWSPPAPDPPNRWSTLRCLYWAHPLHTQTHKTTIIVFSLWKTQFGGNSVLWCDTYCCKVGEGMWGSSTGDPQCDPLGKALSRKDSGYLHRAKTQESWD